MNIRPPPEMERYFFDTFDNGVATLDDVGLEFANREAVRRQAVKTLPHMALDALPDGQSHELRVEVRQGDGPPIFRACLSFRSEWLDDTPGDAPAR